MNEFWLRQEKDKPSFPDILWSRPENKQTAGKLLIIGGSAQGFSSVGEAYQQAVAAGAGTVRVLLPDILRKTVGTFLENCEFAPSNPSGGFAKQALGELLLQAEWADAVLLCGDFGRNSETAILLETFVQKYKGILTITRDAVDYFSSSHEIVLKRPGTTLVLSLAQLQKLAVSSHFPLPISLNLDLIKLVETLHEFTLKNVAGLMTYQLGTTIVAIKGQVSTTKNGGSEDIWRLPTATKATVFWLQNPGKPFESITASLFAKV